MVAEKAATMPVRGGEICHNRGKTRLHHPRREAGGVNSSYVSSRRCNDRRPMPRPNRSKRRNGNNKNYKCPAHAHDHVT